MNKSRATVSGHVFALSRVFFLVVFSVFVDARFALRALPVSTSSSAIAQTTDKAVDDARSESPVRRKELLRA